MSIFLEGNSTNTATNFIPPYQTSFVKKKVRESGFYFFVAFLVSEIWACRLRNSLIWGVPPTTLRPDGMAQVNKSFIPHILLGFGIPWFN